MRSYEERYAEWVRATNAAREKIQTFDHRRYPEDQLLGILRQAYSPPPTEYAWLNYPNSSIAWIRFAIASNYPKEVILDMVDDLMAREGK